MTIPVPVGRLKAVRTHTAKEDRCLRRRHRRRERCESLAEEALGGPFRTYVYPHTTGVELRALYFSGTDATTTTLDLAKEREKKKERERKREREKERKREREREREKRFAHMRTCALRTSKVMETLTKQ